MYLLDSLTSKKINLDNLKDKKKINIYTCGPTVYDFVHIGNAKPLILTDLMIRILKYKKYDINFLLNITDIDDKIIKVAKEKNKSELEIANFFYKAFINDYHKLNLNFPNKILRVTENIDIFINYIKNLINSNNAYVKNGNVIFDISKIDSYGNLSKNKIANLIKNNSALEKENELDFVLWKNTTEGIKWNSLWGEGRPGWHLECAVFIDTYFKNELDMHIGGVDLKFPHHENERAIFLAKNNSEIAKLWLHNGLLHINNNKMSKSLKNSFYLHEFLDQYDANTLKYLFYLKRYMQPLNIDENVLSFVKKELTKIANLIIKFEQIFNTKNVSHSNDLKIEANKFFEIFLKDLEDNLNTANALETLKAVVKKINISLRSNIINLFLYEKFLLMLDILGFSFEIIKHKFDEFSNGILIKNKQDKQIDKKNILVDNKK